VDLPILLVDDSALVRVATSRRLAERGLQVTALGSWREAQDVDASGFAAALLDVDLGDGLGTDVAAHLRAGAPALPIAFLTAHEDGTLLDAARAFGPVFSKATGIGDAISWVLAVVAT